jgi:hypothetical protein
MSDLGAVFLGAIANEDLYSRRHCDLDFEFLAKQLTRKRRLST